MIIRVGLIGDHDESVTAHRAIPIALELAGDAVGIEVQPEWHHTNTRADVFMDGVRSLDALWCVPASPYASTEAALSAIRFARQAGRPFLGTCGGFQHALLEYARASWDIADPAHAEIDPSAINPVIAPLECALVEQTGTVRFAPGSRIAEAYGQQRAVEGYHCSYGLNPYFAKRLDDGPLHATAWDDAGDVRCVELDDHPFFVATLFQPERAALSRRVPPIVRAFIEAVVEEA